MRISEELTWVSSEQSRRLFEWQPYNLNDVHIVVEGLSGDGSRHCDDDQGICDEGQSETSQRALRNAFAGISQVARHTRAASDGSVSMLIPES